MHWKEAVRKFTDVQAKKMPILKLQVPLSHHIQSLVLLNALQKIFAVFFSINSIVLR